jgi:nucleoside-diphosphate-sugar epimerase
VRALVTGSAGFVGRHMVAELRDRGWEVSTADLRSGVDARDVFRYETTRYDLVIHCAFHVGGRAAIDGEPRLLARNLELDALLFNWAVRTGQGRVLYFSSSAAYPVDLQDDLSKRHRLHEHFILFDSRNVGRPDARYGWAKLTGEELAAAARLSGLDVTVVRPFSGYGEDQDNTYPFRAIVERARRREDPFVIWGPGTQVRDWIHIDDVVAGSLALVEAGVDEPVNLCTGIGTSMLELAKMCCAEVGYEPTFTPLVDKPTGVGYRVGDPSRFHRYWHPKVTLGEGVRRALAKPATGGVISAGQRYWVGERCPEPWYPDKSVSENLRTPPA